MIPEAVCVARTDVKGFIRHLRIAVVFRREGNVKRSQGGAEKVLFIEIFASIRGK